MNIDDAVTLKEKLESELASITNEKISNFEKQTGCKVSSVYFDRIDASTKSEKEYLMGSIEINAEL